MALMSDMGSVTGRARSPGYAKRKGLLDKSILGNRDGFLSQVNPGSDMKSALDKSVEQDVKMKRRKNMSLLPGLNEGLR